MIVFHISGEHEELPKAEISALYEAYGTSLDIESEQDRYILANDLPPDALHRLALTHEFYSVFKLSTLKNLSADLAKERFDVSSYSIRAQNFDNNSHLEAGVGAELNKAWGIPVKFKGPELELFLIQFGNRVAVCDSKHTIDKAGFKERDPLKRPFFSPVALKPKLSRLFVNLSRAKEGDTLLDPFCGTGSILIEAASMGVRAIGNDRDKKMYYGCKKNLKQLGLEAELLLGDIGDLKPGNPGLETVDAIATDPPYARASKVFGSELGEIYPKFLQVAKRLLKRGGYMAFAIPHDIGLDTQGFKVIGRYDIYVHKSLSRRLYVLRK